MMNSSINYLNIFDDFMQQVQQIGNRFSTFISRNYQNPLLWVGLCIFLFGLAAWAINYLNR